MMRSCSGFSPVISQSSHTRFRSDLGNTGVSGEEARDIRKLSPTLAAHADNKFAFPLDVIDSGLRGGLVLQLLVQVWLNARQVRHVAQHRHAVPAVFAPFISLQSHQKAADYTLAKARLGLAHMAWGTLILLGWTLLGGLNLLNELLLQAMEPGMLQQLVLLSCFALISGLLDLPFSYYQTFVLEARWL